MSTITCAKCGAPEPENPCRTCDPYSDDIKYVEGLCPECASPVIPVAVYVICRHYHMNLVSVDGGKPPTDEDFYIDDTEFRKAFDKFMKEASP